MSTKRTEYFREYARRNKERKRRQSFLRYLNGGTTIFADREKSLLLLSETARQYLILNKINKQTGMRFDSYQEYLSFIGRIIKSLKKSGELCAKD